MDLKPRREQMNLVAGTVTRDLLVPCLDIQVGKGRAIHRWLYISMT
jgi:hypothetical protein